MEQPRYDHDCDQCLYLGRQGGYDLYVDSEMGIHPTLLCRYGNKPHEYKSGIDMAVIKDADASYRRALVLALQTQYREDIIRYFKRNEKSFPDRSSRFQKILKE